ncbi:MAG: sialate O-acetylesterase [Pedobacter sp.]|uniref:sialate O-acetylesterase n=1 Tax=Pedobacter sp. TaxID=1411316 RepID=UPI00339A1B43
MKLVAAITAITSCIFSAAAEVVPNSLFSSHGVLQRNQVLPVWGTARDGEKVSVDFAGQRAETIAKGGKWMVKIKPLKAGGPFNMVIKGDNTVTLTDILIGEVWVCGGQSNMAYRLSPAIYNGAEEIKNANYPQIRLYYVPNKVARENVEDIKSTWQPCSPELMKNFTAVGYFFARDLYKELNVPIGVISSSVGGTPAEYWLSRPALESNPALQNILGTYDNQVATYPARLEKYKREEPVLLEKYTTEAGAAKKENKPAPRKPTPPQNPKESGNVGGHFYGMIEPLQPYAIRGVIWYQGEANSSRAKEYQSLFPALIADWRSGWGQGDFPFLFVQIAPFNGISPEIREAQLLTWQKTPNTAMVVTTDCGNAEDIHPTLKQPVGARLALAARALAYREKIEYSGPVYQSMVVRDAKAILTFSHQKKLVAKGDGLKGFVIAGADKKFVPAKVEIQGNRLVVYSPDVAAPVAVRYGWANSPDVNLYNEHDLPASPFRTDSQ